MNALFLGTPDDEKFLPYLKGLFGGATTSISLAPIELLSHLEMLCAKKAITAVVSTNTVILAKLIALQSTSTPSSPSLENYAGSVFTYKNLEIVFIQPIRQLATVPYGRFLTGRYISKVLAPQTWREPTEFSWTLVTATNVESLYAKFTEAYAIAIDIETLRTPLSIRCIGYTAVFISNAGNISSISIVIPLDSEFALAQVRRFNNLPAQKIFQKGKYDNSYLLRYNAQPTNWLWDTANLFHSHYSELPKDLGFLNAFFLRKVVYWKDLAETNDLFEYYKYNALDTWATANVWISQMLSMPDWAKRNYALEFPLVFPCLLSEMTGLRRDQEILVKARKEVDIEEARELQSLQRMLGAPAFNPGSWQQVLVLLKILGCQDIKSTEEKDLLKAKIRHPLNGVIIDKILSIRGLRKLRSNYLRTEDDAVKTGMHAGEKGAKEFKGRILYALNPDGTDTGRLASKEHHFWCGLQIQNVIQGPTVKQTLGTDLELGLYIAECDLEQAESRDTAHIAGDTALISAVSGTRDFHSVNASAFFGVSYDSIYDDGTGKTKDKPLRNLSKRTNHGANYNMGPDVMVDTVGLPAVWEAKRLLKLPYTIPGAITEHLLTVFHLTYPSLRGPITIRNESVRTFLKLPVSENKLYAPNTYYASVAREVVTTNRITSRAFHHTDYNLSHFTDKEYIEQGDWVRYCFGSPDKNKLHLNSYVAHCPQSLNARTLNEAYMRVFYDIALPNPTTFRLYAQIHDSILFAYAQGFGHPEAVKERMEIPVTVRDISGTYRTFTVPAALKTGIGGKLATYWSEIE